MVDLKQPGLSNVAFRDHMHIYLGGKNVELFYFGKSHTGGDIVAYFPDDRALAAGDMFTYGDATPQLIDYAGGGSAKEWTATVNRALQLDFDTVVPGHGVVTNKAQFTKFRDSTLNLRNKVHEMLMAKSPRADIEKVLRTDYNLPDPILAFSLDGMLSELR